MVSNSKNTVDNVVLNSVLTFVKNNKVWSGTMTELGSRLRKLESGKNLPKSPAALRTVLNRIVNRIRTRGVGVKFVRSNDYIRTRKVRFAA